jgi:asparagine synthetase B (glutamine-hydrolysing)
MCGIAGLLEPRRTGRCVVEQVRLAVAAMRHRGPDDEVATEVAGRGAWGMCRLAIRDPSPAGRQPFWHGPVGVIFNGEIYNTEELSKALEARGHVFRTRCDTEVLLKAYVEFGSAAFGLFDGIFAAAVVDPVNNAFLLAGQVRCEAVILKPTSNTLAFASSRKRSTAPVRSAEESMRTSSSAIWYQYVPEPVRRGATSEDREGRVVGHSLDNLRMRRTERFVQPKQENRDRAARTNG